MGFWDLDAVRWSTAMLGVMPGHGRVADGTKADAEQRAHAAAVTAVGARMMVLYA